MHDLAFADSARPSRVVCLRLLLLPYSLGHEVLLWQSRNPLLVLDREDFNGLPANEQILSLVRAVSICSRNWSENQKPERWVRLWGFTIRKTDWPVAIADFRNYLDAGRSMLKTLSSAIPEDAEAYKIANNDQPIDAGGRSLGAPFASQLLVFAVDKLKLPLAEAWDAPFALLGNLYLTHLESEGRLYIENHREAQVRAEMAEHYAAIQREREKAKAQPDQDHEAAPEANDKPLI